MRKLKILFFLLLLCIPNMVKAESLLSNTVLLLEDDKIITEITKENRTDESYIVCKENTYIPYQIVRIVRTLITLIKYVVPIVLIIMGMLDFGKVVIGNPDEQMKKSKSAFLSRLLAAVLVFFVIYIVEILIRVVSTEDENLNCLKCIVTEENCRYVDITYPEEPNKPKIPLLPETPSQNTETPKVETNNQTEENKTETETSNQTEENKTEAETNSPMQKET